MTQINKPVGIGIDLGSSAVRVGIYDFEDEALIEVKSLPVPYYHNPIVNNKEPNKNWEYTQKSNEIMEGIFKCFDDLQISRRNIASCGVSATCSMVISQWDPDNNEIIKSPDNNDVIFWMDNSATKETKILNRVCDKDILNTLGGAFIPEMGIPKLLKFINNISNPNLNYIVFDLHRYICYELMKKFGWTCLSVTNKPNSNLVGNDGEIFGWSKQFYQDVLHIPPNIIIGLPEKLSPKRSNAIMKSCIDCYSSWFAALSGNSIDNNNIFIAAGTSTCCLFIGNEELLLKGTSHKDFKMTKYVEGMWGPFTDIFDPKHPVYEGGASCSGKLLEHLFKTHKASTKPMNEEIEAIEAILSNWEQENESLYYWNTKYLFYYGDLDGNRTPFADPEMRGMFIGESTGDQYDDLIHKYVTCLEFLAFQITVFIDEFKKLGLGDIYQLIITGSQAKNGRLLRLISLINDNIKIKIPKENVDLMGVKGAFFLGKASSIEIPLFNILSSQSQINNNFIEVSADNHESTKNLEQIKQILMIKKTICSEMAKQQQKYRQMINNSLKC